MRQLIILASLILPIQLLAQTLEFDNIHWEKSDGIEKKIHVKEVIPFEGVNAAKLHEIVELWYLNTFFNEKLVFSYRFHGVSGDWMWQRDRKVPFLVNEPYRLWTNYVKCYNCFLAWPKEKFKQDGYFRMDIRIKDERLLLVLADHYYVDDDSFLSAWLLKNGKLDEKSDTRGQAVVDHFKLTKRSLIEFIDNYTGSSREIDQPNEGIDNW